MAEKQGLDTDVFTPQDLAGSQLWFKGAPLSVFFVRSLPSLTLSSYNLLGKVNPAAGKPLYEAQNSDFSKRKVPDLREFSRNWRNCAKKIFA